MRRLISNKHIFLFLSLCCFLAAILFWYFIGIGNNKTGSNRSIASINNAIHGELEKVSKQGDELKNLIKTVPTISFTELRKYNATFPYFIFVNKELVIWSTYKFAPSIESLRGDFNLRFVQLRNGKYIVQKRALKKDNKLIEFFIFLPLSHEYSIHNNYIKSGLNEEIFGSYPFIINPGSSKQGSNVYSKTGEFLFSIDLAEHHNFVNTYPMLSLVLVISLGVIFLFLYLFTWVLSLRSNGWTGWSIILLGLGLISIRLILLAIDFPFGFYEFDLFNSRYFASSSLSPSLGDMLINVFCMIIFSWFLFNNYHGTVLYRRLVKAKGKWKSLFAITLAFFSFLILYLVFYFLGILSYHSQWSLDITSNLDFDIFRINSLVIFIALFIIYFFYSHILFRLYISFNSNSYKKVIIKFLIGLILFSLFSFFFLEFYWVIILVNVLYFSILYILNLPRTIGSIRYSTYIYFLLCAMVCSFTGAYSIYKTNIRETNFDKLHYANDLLFKNDVFGEFLLNEASARIKEDEFIKNRLLTPLSSKDLIEYKIRRVFLSNYFDKYNVKISVFDYYGNGYDGDTEYLNYNDAEGKYRKNKYRTDFSDIYFITDSETGAKKYISFNEIHFNNVLIGYVIIELNHKKDIPNSVYPELFENRVSDKDIVAHNYNYAVYSKGKLLYSFGDYNYGAFFESSWLNDSELYSEGIINEGFLHTGIMYEDGKVVIVSSPKYTLLSVFSNFSFLFLLLILFTLIYIIIYAIYVHRILTTATYATKIQVYLNIAFFLPLLIVSITTLSIIGATYKENLNNSFIKKAEHITTNITSILNSIKNESQRERVENILIQIAKYTESDINIYNNTGRLIFTNQPMIHELGFTSRLINPKAYANMIESSFYTTMVHEGIGDLKYNVVYVSIRSPENNQLLAVLSMPFFESKNELDKQIIEVLTTIVNIFVSIFILFIILSYFASHILTVPLKIITQKLKRTNFEENEPIEWKSKDEIGLLVEEYNSMLSKLEESREALSKSEKESAWREMAKQVAHEIKNPLTPMKLTIQHLQRSVDSNDEGLVEKTKKALNMLLDQVNNLSEIATSFSMFAKMPIPKTKKFEISSVLAKVASLHNNSAEVDVETSIEKGGFFVLGDEQLMNGIFTNLILNGIQSVSGDKKAHIKVRLAKKDSAVLIEIEDNGEGIPAPIRDKVFLPNFSTKFSGSGIGLAVAKRGVEHAGGRIWFETQDGQGTIFYLEIPLEAYCLN